MVGDLLHIHDDHEQAQMLLPWHVNGTLDPAEAAWFEAHLAQCAECRADLEANRALRGHVANLPPEIETANSPVLGRGAAMPKARSAPRRHFLRRRISFGWSLAGQAAIAAAAVAAFLVTSPPREGDDYDLLGSQPAAASANVIVLFSPETPEHALRDALIRSEARLVDGPTASGAYMVRVPDGARGEALDRLRAMPHVILAEPIDRGGVP